VATSDRLKRRRIKVIRKRLLEFGTFNRVTALTAIAGAVLVIATIALRAILISVSGMEALIRSIGGMPSPEVSWLAAVAASIIVAPAAAAAVAFARLRLQNHDALSFASAIRSESMPARNPVGTRPANDRYKLRDLGPEHDDLTALVERANTGQELAAAMLADILASREDLPTLVCRADAGDRQSARRLALLLAKRENTETLTSRAQSGDQDAQDVLERLVAPDKPPSDTEQVEALAPIAVPPSDIPIAASPWLASRLQRSIKRIIDTTAAFVGLVILSPIIPVLSLSLWIDCRGNPIITQRRIGQHGRPFVLYKFRTLRKSQLGNPADWTIDPDSHLGPIGRFIRALSLDEVPQLINVLKGDMSLVGPRPERPFFVDQFNHTIPGYKLRHRASVGLTGYAVINGLRGDTSILERVQYDNYYIDNWSLWLDFKIMVFTMRELLPWRDTAASTGRTTDNQASCKRSTSVIPFGRGSSNWEPFMIPRQRLQKTELEAHRPNRERRRTATDQQREATTRRVLTSSPGHRMTG
jgi:lipopolysaccharide/colanic/teichoic acid biosynthesis glycosyltransferase